MTDLPEDKTNPEAPAEQEPTWTNEDAEPPCPFCMDTGVIEITLFDTVGEGEVPRRMRVRCRHCITPL